MTMVIIKNTIVKSRDMLDYDGDCEIDKIELKYQADINTANMVFIL